MTTDEDIALALALSIAAREPWSVNYLPLYLLVGGPFPGNGHSREGAESRVSVFGGIEIEECRLINGERCSARTWDLARQMVDSGMRPIVVYVDGVETVVKSMQWAPGYLKRFMLETDAWHREEALRRERCIRALPSSQQYIDAPMWKVLAKDWRRRNAEHNTEVFLAMSDQEQRECMSRRAWLDKCENDYSRSWSLHR